MKKKILIVITALIMVFAMSACGGSKNDSAKLSSGDVVNLVSPPEDFVLEGTWLDEAKGLTMVITENGDKYDVEISTDDSQDESTVWNFSGQFDMTGGFLSYTDGSKVAVSAEEENFAYEDGEGSISYYDGGLLWEDKNEDAGKDCVFVKAAK